MTDDSRNIAPAELGLWDPLHFLVTQAINEGIARDLKEVLAEIEANGIRWAAQEIGRLRSQAAASKL
jgi:hypothetical protein